MHRAVLAAGGASAGLSGPGWLEAVGAHGTPEVRPLVSELAVEPMHLPRRASDEARYVTSVLAGLRLSLVDQQIADIKSRLQRTNPVEDPDAYNELFGDLVPLEQYRIALREQAAR